MNITAQRSIMLAGTIAGLLLAAPVFAQQPPAASPAPAADAHSTMPTIKSGPSRHIIGSLPFVPAPL